MLSKHEDIRATAKSARKESRSGSSRDTYGIIYLPPVKGGEDQIILTSIRSKVLSQRRNRKTAARRLAFPSYRCLLRCTNPIS